MSTVCRGLVRRGAAPASTDKPADRPRAAQDPKAANAIARGWGLTGLSVTPMHAHCEEWFASRIPADWGAKGLEVAVDQDEILVVVDLGEEHADLKSLRLFREATRDERMAIAIDAEKHFSAKVSWGARAGDMLVTFTTYSIPVMTRLRMSERQVLDTLINAGVARSRSDALAWCVRLVGENEKDWIEALRSAFEAVAAERERGPASRRRQPD
jgi:hypothetical protein